MAESGAVGKPALAPIGFGISTFRGNSAYGTGDKTARVNELGEEPDQHDSKARAEAEAELEESRPTGLGARFRQLIEQVWQGQSRSNIKRQQLKPSGSSPRQVRTKSFLLLAGAMVVMALMFFALLWQESPRRLAVTGETA